MLISSFVGRSGQASAMVEAGAASRIALRAACAGLTLNLRRVRRSTVRATSPMLTIATPISAASDATGQSRRPRRRAIGSHLCISNGVTVMRSPTIPRVPGTTKAVVTDLVSQAGGPKQVAHRLRKRMSIVAAYTHPEHPTHMSIDSAFTLTSPSSPVLAEHAAALAGGVFMPLESSSNEPLLAHAARAASEHGEFIAAVMDASADGDITRAEALAIRKQHDDAVRAVARITPAIVAALDGATR